MFRCSDRNSLRTHGTMCHSFLPIRQYTSRRSTARRTRTSKVRIGGLRLYRHLLLRASVILGFHLGGVAKNGHQARAPRREAQGMLCQSFF